MRKEPPSYSLKMYPVTSLNRMFRYAENVGMSPSAIFRMTRLFFGIDVNLCMDEPGVYYESSFYQISRILKSHVIADLLNEIRTCGWFYIGYDSTDPNRIICFASPVFYSEQDEDKLTLGPTVSADLFSSLDAADLTRKKNGINMTTPSINTLRSDKLNNPSGGVAAAKRVATRVESPTTVSEPAPPRLPSFQERCNIYTVWLHSLTDDLSQVAFADARSRIVSETRCSPETADQLFRQMMTKDLQEYFVHQDRFFTTLDSGRNLWLRNMLGSNHFSKTIKSAYSRYLRDLRKNKDEERAQKQADARNNRPNSEYEWQAPDTGVRFYDHPAYGVVQIPADAPPRPSSASVWSFLNNRWTEISSQQ